MFYRLFLIVLLCIALWNPQIPWGTNNVDLFIVIDDSQSMQGKVKQTMWKKLSKAIKELPVDSRISIIRYAKAPVLEVGLTALKNKEIQALLDSSVPPGNRAINRSASNLEEALKYTSRFIHPHRKTVLLIIHDGQQTQGNAHKLLRQLKDQDHLIYQIKLNQADLNRDAWIETLNTPQSAQTDQVIPITAILGSNQLMEGKVSLYVNNEIQNNLTVQLQSNKKRTLQFHTDACKIGSCSIKLKLKVSNDEILQNNTRHSVITVHGQKPLLYVSHSPHLSPLNRSLLSNGHLIETIKPQLFPQTSIELQRYSSIILDDIGIPMIQKNSWLALTQAVRNHGVGLIVLGGANSFSLGAYRHSVLETLLPVTAEPSQSEYLSSLLFLVDKSGSMDTDNNGVSRLALARQAIIETVNSLGDNDRFGLIAFDNEPQQLLPIQHYSDPTVLINRYLSTPATGGTLLKPAMEFAIEAFSNINSDKRLIVLVTDGFWDEQDIQTIEKKILTEKIDIVSLAIGNKVNIKGLERLTQLNNGKLLRVNKIAELPFLMRKEIEQRQIQKQSGEIKVDQINALPFMENQSPWPNLLEYLEVKPKQKSNVYLCSEKGDPLLIMQFAGTGKVIALPAGLSHWATPWLKWPHWTEFTEGLINWAGLNSQYAPMDISIQKTAENLSIHVDALSSNLNWNTVNSGELILTDPDGLVSQHLLQLTAPGKYLAQVSTPKKGTYTLAIKIAAYSQVIHYENELIEEFLPPHLYRQETNPSLDDLLTTWPGDRISAQIGKQQKNIQFFLLIIIFTLYLILLIRYSFLNLKG